MAFKAKNKINGYFLENKTSQDDDEGDSEESDMEDWMDFKDINTFSEAGSQISSKGIKRTAVMFKEYTSGDVLQIYGCFPMTEPWWSAELQVTKQRGPKCNKVRSLVGAPSYCVRNDKDVEKDGLISLLFTRSKVSPHHSEIFLDYVRNYDNMKTLNFDNLLEVLAKFGTISKENGEIMKHIKDLVDAGPGSLIYKCLAHGQFYCYFPQLYPRRFCSLMKMLSGASINGLEEAICSEPWVFGYSNVMASNFRLYGCEATLQSYLDSGLYHELTPVHQDALRIYDDIKAQCRWDGHTFIYQSRLPKRAKLRDPVVSNWAKALDFLEENKVIVRENDIEQQDVRLYRRPLWSAEKNITQGLDTLFNKHHKDPWEYSVDFESSLFADFATDIDQQRAIELIASQPVVCLSGKGGCGKTHVVSRIFKYAEQLLEKDAEKRYNAEKRYQEDLFNESDVLDDMTLTQSLNNFEESFFADKNSQSGINKEVVHQVGCDSDSVTGDCLKTSENVGDLNEASTSSFTNYLSSDTQTGNNEYVSEVILSQKEVNETNVLEGSRFIQNEDLEFYNKKESDGKSEEKEFPVILLTAPTGKAANLLGKRAKLPSNTLHQVIFNYRRWKQQKSKGETDMKWKYSKVQALVVDECSLVSVQTFSTMLSMLIEEGRLRKLVLLGDILQLPSIEPGNFLSDVYSSLKMRGLSIMLKKNHRSEGHLIIDNASRISNKMIEEAIEEIKAANNDDDISCDQDAIVRKLLETSELLKDHKTSQFVAFRRKDCEAINEICCKHYAGHITRSDKNKLKFSVGDKVCCTKNADVMDEISGKKVRLCNGEIFFIKGDKEVHDGKHKKRFLTLGDEEDKEKNYIEVNLHTLIKLCKLKHAWARTIHTYQGSEAGTVIYLVGVPVLQTWQHVYTAVTRGKKEVIIITRSSHLETAVRNEPKKRNTSLKERMKKMLPTLPKDLLFPIGTPSKSILCSPASTSKMISSQGFSKLQLEPTNTARQKLFTDMELEQNNQNNTSESDSQNFSDWGDEMDMSVLLNLAELNQEASCEESDSKDTSGENTSGSIDVVRRNLQSSFGIDNSGGIRLKTCKSSDENDSNDVVEDVLNILTEGSSRKQHPRKQTTTARSSNFNSTERGSINMIEDVLDIFTKDTRQKKFTNKLKGLGKNNGIAEDSNDSHAIQTDDSTPTKVPFSPKRSHVENKEKQIENKYRRLIMTEEPVTSADVSPLRRMLDSTSLQSPVRLKNDDS